MMSTRARPVDIRSCSDLGSLLSSPSQWGASSAVRRPASSRALKAPGSMDRAYCTSRSQLLSWLNETYCLNIDSVERCYSGAIFCQVLDSLHQDLVPMQRVCWCPISASDSLSNYKIIQRALESVGAQRTLPVERMMKRTPQASLEALQWFSWYFSKTVDEDTLRHYHPVERRRLSRWPLPPWALDSEHRGLLEYPTSAQKNFGSPLRGAVGGTAGSRSIVSGSTWSPVVTSQVASMPSTTRFVPSSMRPPVQGTYISQEAVSNATSGLGRSFPGPPVAIQSARQSPGPGGNSLAASGRSAMHTPPAGSSNIEKERDFYYSKLRQIETMTYEIERGPRTRNYVSLEEFNRRIQTVLFAPYVG